MELNAFLAYVSEWLGIVATTWIVSILKLFRERKLIFRFPKREGLAAVGLYVVILVISIVFYSGHYLLNLGQPAGISPAVFNRLVIAGVAFILMIAVLALRKQPWRSVGLSRPLLPGLYLGLALALLTVFLRNKIYTLLGGVSIDEWYTLAACLGLGLAEEIIFRGFIQLRLSSWLGERWGWIAASLMFALWQLPRFTGSIQTVLIDLGLAVVQGFVLGWLMKKTGQSLSCGLYRGISEWIMFLQ